jgi:ferredoxin
MPKDYGLVTLLQLTRNPVKYYAAPQSFFNGEQYLNYINRSKELVRETGADCKVIASIVSFTEEGWENQCNMINNSDADMVELCFSAPAAVYTDPNTGETAQVSSYPHKVEEWTRFCVERIRVPISAKFPGNCPDPLCVIQAAVRAGVKGIQFGGVGAFTPRVPPIVINPDTLELGFMPGNPFGWTRNANWAVPFACGDIHYRDILRFIMAGSSSVQVCTATMVEGVDVGIEYLSDIEAWMQDKGYQSINEIQSIVVNREKLRVDPSKFEADIAQIAGGPTPRVQLKVDKNKCINCGWCEPCCSYLAIKMEEELPVIDDKLCEVCGMCVAVCPTEVFNIVSRESGTESH